MQTGKPMEVDHRDLKPGAKSNARTTGGEQQLGELVASIAAHGLLNPIIARAKGAGYEIIAGNRRWAAIKVLITDGKWVGRVPIVVRNETDSEALDLSLAENVVRLPMHPVDQFEAFARLKMSESEIAAAYGITELAVRQRLALGRLAPEVRAAWRGGDVSAKAAQLFARCPDKKLQATTLEKLSKGGGRPSDWRVEQAIGGGDNLKLDDPRVRFAGLGNYRAAGGEVIEDLFGGDGYVTDARLINDLVEKTIEAKCEALVVDGWGWAEPLGPKRSAWQLSKAQPGKIEPTAEEKKRIEHLERAAKALSVQEENLQDSESIVGDEYSSKSEELELAQEAIRDELETLKDAALARSYSAKRRAELGCVIEVGDGVARIHYGVQKGAAAQAKKAAEKLGLKGHAAEPAAGMSQALLQDLTTRQTIAAASVMAASPDAALRTAIATLLYTHGSPAKISSNGYHEVCLEQGAGLRKFEDALEKIGGLDLNALLGELAKAVAASLDLRCFSHSAMSPAPAALPSTAAMISMLHPGDYHAAMLEQFDHEEYFKRSPAAVAVAAIVEITEGKLTPHESIGKKALVASATERAKAAKWLPPLLRHPGSIQAKPAKKRGRK